MIRIAFVAAAVLASSLASKAKADTVDAFCTLSWHDHTKPMLDGACTFSQHQGNAEVRLGFYALRFTAVEQGKTYQRDNTAERIRFNREGQYTLQVFQGGPPVAKRDVYGGRPPIQDKAKWPLACTINGIASTCRTEPAAKGGFTVFFSHAEGPLFTFTPVGAPTTDRRVMVDGSGQRWAMSGHRSFELVEIGGYGNTITVSNP